MFERISEGKLSVCKVTFGAEPKEYEVYDFISKNYYRLKFSPAVAIDVKEAGHNPKQVQNTGIGTKLQKALKLQQEQLKTERKAVSREQRQFELKQQKRKEKHRGQVTLPPLFSIKMNMVIVTTQSMNIIAWC